MSEKRFVEQLKESARKIDKSSFIWKTNDRFSLGIPDLLIIMRGRVYAIEAKCSLNWGPSTGNDILRHPFSGPQISVLRQIKKAGGFACGAVQVEPCIARILDPDDIPSNGNFTANELEKISFEDVKINGKWNLDEWCSLLRIEKG